MVRAQYVVITPETAGLFAPIVRPTGTIGLVGHGATDSWMANGVDINGNPIPRVVACRTLEAVKKYFASKCDLDDASLSVRKLVGRLFSGSCGGSIVVPDDMTIEEREIYDSAAIAFANGASTIYIAQVSGSDVTDYEEALSHLEGYDIDIVFIANKTETDNVPLIDALFTHVSNTGSRPRIGVFMLKEGETDTNSSGTYNGSPRMLAIAHNRLKTKKEINGVNEDYYPDVAAAVAGKISTLDPWESLLYKSVTGFSQTEFSDSDVLTCMENQINPIRRGFGEEALRIGESLSLGPADNKYIEIQRTIDDLSFKLRANLESPDVLGSIRINESGMLELNDKAAAVLRRAVTAGEIDSFAIQNYVLDAIRTGDMESLNYYQNIRMVELLISVDFAGAVHYIDITLSME